MMRTIRRCMAICTLMLVMIGLVACGGQRAQDDAGTGAVASASPAAVASASPAAVAATSAATVTASASASATSTPDQAQRYAGIAQSTTAEGYYVLGDPAAPVLLMHYSDFL